jgi:hypothetical protein
MHITHGTDSSASLSQQAQAGNDVLNAFNPIGNLLDVATEFLSQSERCCVLVMSGIARLSFSIPLAHLQVRSANLDDVVERLGLLFESGTQSL